MGSADDSTRDLESLATSRLAGIVLAGVVAGLVAALQGLDCAGSTNEPGAREGLVTRSGAVAKRDDVLASRLTAMASYLQSGKPRPAVAEIILDDHTGRALGKDGRVQVAHILDYAYELFARKRPQRHTRDKLFAALAGLNAALDERGFGHYVFGGLHWQDDQKTLERVSFEVYDIRAARRYRAGQRIVSVLHVTRRQGSDFADHRLGFTSAGHSEALVLPAKVDEEIARGLMPALDPTASTPLFDVSDPERRSAWYLALRQVVARTLAADFAEISRDAKDGAGSVGRSISATDGSAVVEPAVRDALLRAVEIHEAQHLLDFERDRQRHVRAGKPEPRQLSGPFRRLAKHLAEDRPALAALYETSAHLAQMARDAATARITLTVVASYGFTDRCDHGDCLAALVILDELAIELGRQRAPRLTTGEIYRLSDLATLYSELAEHPPTEISRAARGLWQRLAKEPLPALEPL